MSGARVVEVAVGGGSYSVHVGGGLLGELGDLVRGAMVGDVGGVLMVADAGVPERLVDAARDSLSRSGVSGAIAPALHVIDPSESVKTLGTLEGALRAAAAAKLDRGGVIVSVGGGVVCDIAGFAAASYRRGVRVVQCPTTLLAMVDASVGGKTGVNLVGEGGSLLKNMVGAFHQPSLVVADTAALESLDPRVFRCGLAECVKHGMIGGGFGFGSLLEELDGRSEGEDLAALIARHVSLKAAVVAADERETAADGGRALLNLGHTFGHAIETLGGLSFESGDGSLMHGEAVGLGLLCATRLAACGGLAPAGLESETRLRLDGLGLPTVVGGLPAGEDLVARMFDDKKVASGALRVVVPSGGCVASVMRADEIVGGLGSVAAAWDAIRPAT